MQLRDLVREGRPAFPPSWQDPHTGSEPLRHEPLAGILVEVEWGRHSLSLELTNYWRGRRLRGRLLTDDATILSRVHALLSASIPRHLDELIDLEIPTSVAPDTVEIRQRSVGSLTEPAPEGPTPRPPSPGPALHPDVALLVATLVRKGVLAPDDLDITRLTLAETSGVARADRHAAGGASTQPAGRQRGARVRRGPPDTAEVAPVSGRVPGAGPSPRPADRLPTASSRGYTWPPCRSAINLRGTGCRVPSR